MSGRVLRAWILVVLCIGLIWTFSGEGFSATTTSRFLGPLLGWIWPDLGREELHLAHVAVRKGAHVVEYALLGLLAFRALHVSILSPLARLALLALALVLAVAGTDELRQAMIQARTGSLRDVALDLGGGALGVALFLGLRRSRGAAPAPAEDA